MEKQLIKDYLYPCEYMFLLPNCSILPVIYNCTAMSSCDLPYSNVATMVCKGCTLLVLQIFCSIS